MLASKDRIDKLRKEVDYMGILEEIIKFIVIFIIFWGIFLFAFNGLSLIEKILNSMNRKYRGTAMVISGSAVAMLLTFLRESFEIPGNIFLFASVAIGICMITGIIDLAIYCFSSDNR